MAPDANHDVRPHPHIGLATVTYLFEGAIDHRDSIGSYQRIEPGAINWMTAGRGIVHSERTPHDLAGQPHRTHGLQLWAALPKAHEEDEPSFTHTPQADIPVVPLDGAVVKVLIGTAFGQTSPVRTYMQTLYLDVALQAGRELRLEGLPPEAAIYPISGDVLVDGVALVPHTMALLEAGAVRRGDGRRRPGAVCRHRRRAAGRPPLPVLEFRLVEQGAIVAGGRRLDRPAHGATCRARRNSSRCRRRHCVLRHKLRLEPRAQGQLRLARLAIEIAPGRRTHRLVVALVE